MKIKRTANAGVLIETDGVSVLLDGICNRVEFYMETPSEIKEELNETFPDIVAFTHRHDDHYDANYLKVCERMTLRPTSGSEVFFLRQVDAVEIISVPTRHMGKADIEHNSFIIKGSKCIWFMGDASPLEWKKKENLPVPDVIIAPFLYANTSSSWNMTKSFGAENIIILHMPDRENDPYGIWNDVEKTIGNDKSAYVPQIGETIDTDFN